MSDPWFRTTQTLRFCDNDSIGHVNNAVYAVMMEAGRTDLLRAASIHVGPERAPDFAPVIVRLEIDFRREMSWPGTVLIETAILRVGTKSIHLSQRVSQGEILAAEGISVLALIDRQTRRAVPLDDALRERFAPWTLPAA